MGVSYAWIVSKKSVNNKIPGWVRHHHNIMDGDYFTHYISSSGASIEAIKKALKNRKDIENVVDSTPESKSEKRRERRKSKIKRKVDIVKKPETGRTKYHYPFYCNTSKLKSAYRRMMRKEKKNG